MYNLKRRIAALSPVTFIFYQDRVVNPADGTSSDDSAQSTGPNLESGRFKAKRKTRRARTRRDEDAQQRSSSSSREATLETNNVEDENETMDARRCLFCSREALSVDINMAHMSQSHSFFLPDMDSLIDLESLLSYLAIIVGDFHECIYCGCVRSCRSAVQDHMRGKGHCKIDVDDERHALRSFYDSADGLSGSDEESVVSEDGDEDEQEQELRDSLALHSNELRLPSGRVASHRSQARLHRGHVPTHRHGESSLAPDALAREATHGQATDVEIPLMPTPTPKHAMVMRAGTSHSMLGVPEVQRRALLAVEQKMLKIEARTRNEYEAAVQRGGNRQKRFKVKSIGKKAGGLEKRCG